MVSLAKVPNVSLFNKIYINIYIYIIVIIKIKINNQFLKVFTIKINET